MLAWRPKRGTAKGVRPQGNHRVKLPTCLEERGSKANRPWLASARPDPRNAAAHKRSPTGENCAYDAIAKAHVTRDQEQIFGGDGIFLAALTGPGKVWLQTLPISKLAHALADYMPRAERVEIGAASGVVGGIVGSLLRGR